MSAQPTNPGSATESVVRDAVAGTGFELESLEEVRAGQRWLIRVIIDSDVGVGLDDITTVSRAVSLALDQRDEMIAGPYTLEVTSPGVDRPLTQPRHWRRFAGWGIASWWCRINRAWPAACLMRQRSSL